MIVGVIFSSKNQFIIFFIRVYYMIYGYIEKCLLRFDIWSVGTYRRLWLIYGETLFFIFEKADKKLL